MAERVVTTTMFTAAERAAWAVAVDRGLAIEAADLRAMLAAAERERIGAWIKAERVATRHWSRQAYAAREHILEDLAAHFGVPGDSP